jgi:general secretion pathway protein G
MKQAKANFDMKACSPRNRGFTLVELIVATSLLLVLTSMVLRLARVVIKREKERDLRRALWQMRDGIDRYKDASERGAFQIKVGSEGYPPDLRTLVDGVDVGGKKLKFLRRIPIDPMTGSTDWGCVRSRMISTPTPGAGTTCSMSLPSRKGPHWMTRFTRIGEDQFSKIEAKAALLKQ